MAGEPPSRRSIFAAQSRHATARAKGTTISTDRGKALPCVGYLGRRGLEDRSLASHFDDRFHCCSQRSTSDWKSASSRTSMVYRRKPRAGTTQPISPAEAATGRGSDGPAQVPDRPLSRSPSQPLFRRGLAPDQRATVAARPPTGETASRPTETGSRPVAGSPSPPPRSAATGIPGAPLSETLRPGARTTGASSRARPCARANPGNDPSWTGRRPRGAGGAGWARAWSGLGFRGGWTEFSLAP